MRAASTAIMTPLDVYDVLMEARRGDPVEDTLARIIASWSLGIGGMPSWLGLGRNRFEQMLEWHFPALASGALPDAGGASDCLRQDEMQDLYRLLMQNRTDSDKTRALMAEIVAAACMGDNHLWEDLGLWSRADLSNLMAENFAPLAARNDRDMKWKRFLYKQLCEAEGIYTCRSPSCEACTDFVDCFGSEE